MPIFISFFVIKVISVITVIEIIKVMISEQISIPISDHIITIQKADVIAVTHTVYHRTAYFPD